MEENNKPWVLIPVLNPDDSFMGFVRLLLKEAVGWIIIINDGSTAEKRCVFDQLSKTANVTVLHHAVNCGKGQAIKTGINYFLLNAPAECPGLVTADADGQHLPQDIMRTAKTGIDNGVFTLGVRNFSGNIPVRSKFGNTLTRAVFKLFTGCSLTDTQTGLRYIPARLLPFILDIAYNRYEYELAVLIKLLGNKEPFTEVQIETVYIDGNRSSHFNPILDSLAIYCVFLRFSGLSIITAIIDYSVFSIAYFLGSSILSSFLWARAIAGTFNFCVAKYWVFRSDECWKREAFRFAVLVIGLMLLSYGFTELINRTWEGYVLFAKLIAEGTIFFASFAIQRLFIFRNIAGVTFMK